MGKGVVADLPEAMDHAVVHPPTGSDPNGVDDLLAQMAGDEIDRLLAEADATRDPLEASEPSVEATEPEPPVIAPAIPSAPPLSPAITASAASVPAAEVVAAMVEALPESPAGVDLESGTTVAERTALDEPVAAAIAAATAVAAPAVDTPPAVPAAPPAAEALHPVEPDLDSLPLYLKPLQWLNSPLALLPQGIRDLVGKIALLTLFNATAVLIYVILFRKHH